MLKPTGAHCSTVLNNALLGTRLPYCTMLSSSSDICPNIAAKIGP